MRVGCCRQAAGNCGLAAHAPRSGSKDCFGETPKPTREAHVLAGVWGNAVPVAMIVNPFFGWQAGEGKRQKAAASATRCCYLTSTPKYGSWGGAAHAELYRFALRAHPCDYIHHNKAP